MSNCERVEAIRALGYTEREAAFLVVAALHGGYFLRRQYTEFIGKETGGTAAALVERLLAKEHARATTALNNTKVYHLASRPSLMRSARPTIATVAGTLRLQSRVV